MGLLIATIVFALWGGTLALYLELGAAHLSPAALALAVLVRTYLTTGLFITAHDAMHGSVARSRSLNRVVGTMAAFLFAAMSYRTLARNHYQHHAHPATERDPDYRGARQGPAGGFWRWFIRFMLHYATFSQLVIIAVIYNVLRLRYDDASLWMYWAGPSLLASLQLFFFGTYLPHRAPHAALGPHRARTLPPIHSLAMLSCYFFGYHREHHESPSTPWWRLYTMKN